MKLLEATGAEAIELLGDLMMPFAELAADPVIANCLKTDQKYKAISYSLKRHPQTVLRFLSVCEGVPFEDYKPTALEIPAKLMEVINNPTVQGLFFTPQEITENFGGSVTATTEVHEK